MTDSYLIGGMSVVECRLYTLSYRTRGVSGNTYHFHIEILDGLLSSNRTVFDGNKGLKHEAQNFSSNCNAAVVQAAQENKLVYIDLQSGQVLPDDGFFFRSREAMEIRHFSMKKVNVSYDA